MNDDACYDETDKLGIGTNISSYLQFSRQRIIATFIKTNSTRIPTNIDTNNLYNFVQIKPKILLASFQHF